MSFLKKTHSAPAAEDPHAGMDVDQVMKKYDRESNVRIWEGWQKIALRWLMAVFSLYCIGMTLFSTAGQEVRLSAFLGCIVVIGYLNYPASKHHVRTNYMPWYDILLMIVGAGCFFYYTANAMKIIQMSVNIGLPQIIIAVVGILCLMELCRRCVGLPILFVVGALLIYTFVNLLSAPGKTFLQVLRRVSYTLFYTTSGAIGTPISTCYKYIVLFIIFGAFLERTGIANFFISLANKLAGWSSGGPAKVAVISSALCGIVSGSSVGNTVTTGSVTIPMMKKTGYKPEFAGAVEAAASTGGQIMPPIMGAAAFLLAEYMNELPKWRDLVTQIYLLAPLVLLVWLVSAGTTTMQRAAVFSILAAVLVGFLNHKERLTPEKILEALEAGGKGAITVSVACGMAGMIAGCVTVTGLASKLISGVLAVTSLVPIPAIAMFIGLFLTMFCCIVLGMGVPTTANFCIMASTCAPILIKMGLPDMAAYFFVFYFGIVADITPPVALAAYAGAAIAKANPMKTGVNATKLAIAAFIVPYIFAYSPAMLFINVGSWLEVVQIILSALLGLFGIAAALNGHLFRHIPWLFRAALVAGGICMMIPGTVSDLIGFLLLAGVVLWQKAAARKVAAAA